MSIKAVKASLALLCLASMPLAVADGDVDEAPILEAVERHAGGFHDAVDIRDDPGRRLVRIEHRIQAP